MVSSANIVWPFSSRETWKQALYFTPTSLDGHIADETGNFDWVAPDEEVFGFHHQSLPPHRHLSLWTQDVRDDGDLGDARRHSWSDAGHVGLRADLASGRQDRLFQIAGNLSTRKTRLEWKFEPQLVRD